MNLQRPLVWTLFQKQQLIISVLKGIKLGSIAIILHDDESNERKTTYQIIDGKQRFYTLISFYKGEFPIEVDGENYYYNDLDEDAAHLINGYSFVTNRIYEYPDAIISDDIKIKWFEMINFAGTAQDIEHMTKLKTA